LINSAIDCAGNPYGCDFSRNHNQPNGFGFSHDHNQLDWLGNLHNFNSSNDFGGDSAKHNCNARQTAGYPTPTLTKSNAGYKAFFVSFIGVLGGVVGSYFWFPLITIAAVSLVTYVVTTFASIWRELNGGNNANAPAAVTR
jgi:hypothetical protein